MPSSSSSSFQHHHRKNASPYSEASHYLNILLTNPTLSLKTLAFSPTAATAAGIKLPKKQKTSSSSSATTTTTTTTTLTCSKSTYATLSQLLHYKHVIDDILSTKTPGQLILSQSRNKPLVYVMIYELLFSKYKKIRGGGALKRVILGYESSLRELAAAAAARSGDVVGGTTDGRNGSVASFPRYVRVNSLYEDASVMEVARVLRDTTFKTTDDNDSTTADVYMDRHVPDLLVLAPGTDLHDHSLVNDGRIILQDKSSCFPALVLTNGGGGGGVLIEGDVIDACAAPGNKTSHLAALLSSSSSSKRRTIFAVERDERRMTLLKERMTTFGASSKKTNNDNVNVTPIHDDFLALTPSDPRFTNVTAILLDPSCSGSGMIHRPKIRQFDDCSRRKEALTNFQAMALRHAMSFPQVNRVVYSTCSIDVEENEAVVGGLLRGDEENGEGLETEWAIASPACLEGWTRRGWEGAGGLTREETSCLVRCDGREDDTCGFFVCLLMRKSVMTAADDGGGGGGDESQEEETTTAEAALDHPTAIVGDNSSIPFYDGQFKSKPNVDKNPIKKLSTDTTSDADTTTTTTESPKQMAQSSPTKTTTSSSHVTKKEKRLKWKQKQAAMKTKRLKKKKMKLLQAATGSPSL